MGLDAGLYMSSLQDAVDFANDVAGSLLKALVFGILVGLIATYRGYTDRADLRRCQLGDDLDGGDRVGRDPRLRLRHHRTVGSVTRMRRSPTRDFIVGLFVLVGLAALAYLSLSIGGVSYSGPKGFLLYGNFDETGGLKPRAPVVISGVKVGEVASIGLNDDYRAKVTLQLSIRALKLPIDTTASIVTSGLLGDRYVSLQPGGEDQLLKSGEEIEFVESAVILERMIGKLIHNTDVGGGNGKTKAPEAEPAP